MIPHVLGKFLKKINANPGFLKDFSSKFSAKLLSLKSESLLQRVCSLAWMEEAKQGLNWSSGPLNSGGMRAIWPPWTRLDGNRVMQPGNPSPCGCRESIDEPARETRSDPNKLDSRLQPLI